MRRKRGLVLWAAGCLLAAPLSSAAAEKAEAPPRYRLAYASFIGGSQWEQPREIIPCDDGTILIGGQTSSPDLPVTAGAVQRTYGGEPPGSGHPGVVGGDCFVARLAPGGGRFAFVTYFGGSKQERATYGMLTDRRGNVVITTGCRSRDLPTTAGAYQRKYGGGPNDVLLAKLSADGRKIVWCTYLGGRGSDWPRGGIALDADDNVIVVGRSDSPDFPATAGVLRPRVKGRNGDAMIVKVKADGSALVWATLLGGSDSDGLMGAQVDKGGNVHVAGHTRSDDLPVSAGAPQRKRGGESDVFFAALTADGSKLRYCTYLGGSGNEFAEHRPAMGADGSVLLTGVTSSGDFPTTAGALQRRLKGKNDGFLVKLGRDGRLIFSTLLGGSAGEFLLMPTIGPDGSIYVVGQTSSRDFPVTPDALQKRYAGGRGDAVLAVLSGDGGKLLYATYLGGSGDDLIRGLAVGKDGTVYLTGNTNSADFPVTAGAAQPKPGGRHDGVIVKLVPRERRRTP